LGSTRCKTISLSIGRRNYGELIYDHDNFTDIWGTGPAEFDASIARKSLYTMAGWVGLVFGLLWLWDPAKQVKWSEPQFPFENLKKARGE
jgi:hypothetical protein